MPHSDAAANGGSVMRLLWPRRFPKRRVATIAERVSLGARRRSSSGRRRTLWVARRRNAGTPPARCLTAYGRAGTPTERYAVAANVVTCHGPALCSNNTDRLQPDFTSTQPAATVATTAGPRRRTACQRSAGPAALLRLRRRRRAARDVRARPGPVGGATLPAGDYRATLWPRSSHPDLRAPRPAGPLEDPRRHVAEDGVRFRPLIAAGAGPRAWE
jgi:hypothetical protein